jgi:hypothetical protein
MQQERTSVLATKPGSEVKEGDTLVLGGHRCVIERIESYRPPLHLRRQADSRLAAVQRRAVCPTAHGELGTRGITLIDHHTYYVEQAGR